jgi:hypothetical protein
MASHNIPRPNPAPACEYVAIPDGSSSDAPVIRPGPKNLRAFLNLLNFETSLFFHSLSTHYYEFECQALINL